MKIEHFKNFPDYKITLTQAAQVLGYKDYRFVEKLINQKYLTPYKIPVSKRPLLSYHEVMDLPKIQKP
jgi:hypothetical protein